MTPHSERTLSSEQQPDGELEESELMAYDRAEELADEFADIESRTISDGMVYGTVKSIDMATKNGTIVVGVDVPAEPDPVRFNLKKPKVWSREYDFVRWVQDHGYAADDFAGMVEKNVRVDVRYEDGDYTLVIPERVGDRAKTRLDSLRQLVQDIGKTLADGVVVTLATIFTLGLWLGTAWVMSWVVSGSVGLLAALAVVVGSVLGGGGVMVVGIILEEGFGVEI